jgi:hypothetical protein
MSTAAASESSHDGDVLSGERYQRRDPSAFGDDNNRRVNGAVGKIGRRFSAHARRSAQMAA